MKTTEQLRRLIKDASELPNTPEFRVEFGSPAETILKVAKQSTDTIVLDVLRPKDWSPRLHLGTAYKVVREATCPVLTVGRRRR